MQINISLPAMTLRLRSARPADLRVILAELGKLSDTRSELVAVADNPALPSSAADAQPLIAGDVAKAAYRVLTKFRCLNDADRVAHTSADLPPEGVRACSATSRSSQLSRVLSETGAVVWQRLAP